MGWIMLGAAVLIAAAVVALAVLRRSTEPAAAAAAAPPGTPPADLPLPEWAAFFRAPARLERFEAAVLRYFEQRNARVAVEDGWVRPMEGPQGAWGLTNVGQACAAEEDETQWPGLIAHHFDMMFRVRESADALREESGDFARVRDRITLRLWEPYIIERVPVVSREDVPGLLTVLSIDSEEAVQTVKPDVAALWGIDEHALFDLALENTRRLLGEVTVQSIDGTRLKALGSDNGYYLATLALDVDAFPGLFGRHGAFIAVPQRGVILAVPFDTLEDSVEGLSQLMHFTTGLERDGPGSLSRRVYWRHEGTWTEIPYEIADSALNVSPPQALLDLLEEIVEPG